MNNQAIKQIAKRYGLEALLLFGSRAKGDFLHQESDFDVAYIAKKRLSFETEARLIVELMAYFKSDRVDLVNLKRAGPLLRINIMKHYQLLYKRSSFSLAPEEIYAEKLYFDSGILFKMTSEYLDKKLKFA